MLLYEDLSNKILKAYNNVENCLGKGLAMRDGKIIVELKAVAAITCEHVAQTLNYVNLTHSKLGYILNFSQQEGRGFKRLLGQAARNSEE